MCKGAQVRWRDAWYTARGIEQVGDEAWNVYLRLKSVVEHTDPVVRTEIFEQVRQSLTLAPDYHAEDWQDVFPIVASGDQRAYSKWWEGLIILYRQWHTVKDYEEKVIDVDAWFGGSRHRDDLDITTAQHNAHMSIGE